MLISVFGVHGLSPWSIHRALHDLKVSHSVAVDVNSVVGVKDFHIKGTKEQPAWPVITTKVNKIQTIVQTLNAYGIKGNKIVIVCSSADDLQHHPKLPVYQVDQDSITSFLKAQLVQALKANGKFDPSVTDRNEPSIEDYINKVAAPGFTDTMQTMLYAITPYNNQKMMRHAVMNYLFGGSVQAFKSKVNENLKFKDLGNWVLAERGAKLREAVKEARTHPDPIKAATPVGEKYGIDDFEIRYVLTSAKK